jgi:hypothetical protein
MDDAIREGFGVINLAGHLILARMTLALGEPDGLGRASGRSDSTIPGD